MAEELIGTIQIDASDSASIANAVSILGTHVAALHDDVHALTCDLAASVTLAEAGEHSPREAMRAAIAAVEELGKGKTAHALDMLRTLLEAGPRPPKGGTQLRLVARRAA
jgi:hypothetical protein